jgi:hypothetical protein
MAAQDGAIACSREGTIVRLSGPAVIQTHTQEIGVVPRRPDVKANIIDKTAEFVGKQAGFACTPQHACDSIHLMRDDGDA